MTDQRPNSDEGADPSNDLKAQNPGETTTADLTRPDETVLDDENDLDDPDNRSDIADTDRTKTQDLTQAGRDTDFAGAQE